MKNFYLFIVLMCVCLPAFAQEAAAPAAASSEAPAPDKKELILKFIDVFGTRQAMSDNLTEMLKTMPEDSPDTKKLKEGIKVDEIIERLVPIYDKQFSAKELQAFIDFYSSPDGQKLVRGIPVIMKESVDVSSKYFSEKFPEMQQTPPAAEVQTPPEAASPAP